MMFKPLLWFFFSALIFQSTHAQLTSEDPVYKQIMSVDSLLFQEGFNKCNFQDLHRTIAEDVEMYHDLGGTTFGKENFIESVRKNICSISYKPIREIIKGSQSLYPLKNNGDIYGVLQNGAHNFYAKEGENEPYLTSTARFSHLWIIKNGEWALKRVVSYDHRSPNKITERITDGRSALNRAKIENLLEKEKVPAVGIAIIRNGKLTESNVFGHLAENTPAPKDAIFNVASLTKPIISFLTLTLVENGNWNLDEPLFSYWIDPDVKEDPRHKLLTTRHVLSHQTGFKNWRRENESGKLEFDFAPGKGFRYSGEGFEYLKKALENHFRQPIEVLADSLVFRPLAMKDTQFYWDASIDPERFAKWHNSEGRQEYPVYKNKEASAADDLLTTIEDYGKFAEHLLTGGGLSPFLFGEMVTPQNAEDNGVKMGLGWEILPNLKGREYALLHTGGDAGVQTLVILLPETKEGLVILTNGDNGNRLYFPLIEEYLSLGKEITGADK